MYGFVTSSQEQQHHDHLRTRPPQQQQPDDVARDRSTSPIREEHPHLRHDRLPRLAIVQAEGASPLYRAYQNGFEHFEPMKAKTVASAIKIGNPVNYAKAIRSLKWTDGVVEMVTDQEIMDAKALIDANGIGCEPASACSLAGARKLSEAGIIKPGETVVGVLTGHVLKDPDAVVNYHTDNLEDIEPHYPNRLHEAEGNVEEIAAILSKRVPTI